MSDNVVTQVLKAAKRHPDNVAVQTLVAKLQRAQAEARAEKGKAITLDGYHRGAEGDAEHGLMYDLDASNFAPMLRQMSKLREVAVVAECLADVLSALGERIDY